MGARKASVMFFYRVYAFATWSTFYLTTGKQMREAVDIE